jgi:hypothetical protein
MTPGLAGEQATQAHGKAVSPENGVLSTEFTYRALPNLAAALEQAGNDFRSDVVTAPTENMMQVRQDIKNMR